MPGSATTTVLVLVEAGSEYETKEINGLSHFLEHMCFKGTTRRPKPIMIPKELEALGASYNAFTSTEYTGYYAKAINANFLKILDLVSGLYINPIIDPAEIEKERGVITEELNMYEDIPMQKVHSVLQEAMYGDQPAGWEIGGSKETVSKLTREDFIKYRSARYVAANTLVVIAGAIDEKNAISEVEKAFHNIPVGDRIPKSKTVISQTDPVLKLKTKESDQTHIALGFRAYEVRDPRRFALSVLSTYLGEGMSSRLFATVRDQLGAAYYISSEADEFMDHGELVISAGLNHEKLELAIKTIFEQCRMLKDKQLTATELDEIKQRLVSSFAVYLETSDAIARYYGSQEISSGEILTPEEVIQHYLKVTSEEVQNVAKDVFKNSSLNLALVGPEDDKASLQGLLTVE
jgi:predicted Zn-dependent peptidase